MRVNTYISYSTCLCQNSQISLWEERWVADNGFSSIGIVYKSEPWTSSGQALHAKKKEISSNKGHSSMERAKVETSMVPYNLGFWTQPSNTEKTNTSLNRGQRGIPRSGGFVSGFYQNYFLEINNVMGPEYRSSDRSEVKCPKCHKYFCFITKFDFLWESAPGRDPFERLWYSKELCHYPEYETTRRCPRSKHIS